MALNSLSSGTSIGKERHYPDNTIEQILGMPERTLRLRKETTEDSLEKSSTFQKMIEARLFKQKQSTTNLAQSVQG